MSKPYTEDDLAFQLNQDIAWRVREISDLKSAIQNADTIAKSALLRAIVAIMYAHWEGHVRFSAQRFLMHISLRRLQFSVLKRQFLKNHFLPRIAAVSRKSVQEKGVVIDAILDAGSERFSHVNEDLINTHANLNSNVLKEICSVCGVDPLAFREKETFIDIILLKRRNAIAHGEDTFINVSELDNLVDETVSLMRTFSGELQNIAYLGSYRAA